MLINKKRFASKHNIGHRTVLCPKTIYLKTVISQIFIIRTITQSPTINPKCVHMYICSARTAK